MPKPGDWEPTLDDINTDICKIPVLPKSQIITGQAGAGKTSLAATAQEGVAAHFASGSVKEIVLEKMIWLLSDDQGVSALTVRGIRPRYVVDICALSQRADGDMRLVLQWVYDYLDKAAGQGCDYAVVDTVTSLGEYLERWYVAGNGCPVSVRTNNPDTQKGWGIIGDKYADLHKTIRELNYRSLWLAHPKTNSIEEEALDTKAKATIKAKAVVAGAPGDNYIVPAISGQKFARLLKAHCSISGWLRAEFVNGQRKTMWMPLGGDGSQGKNRYEHILDREEPADLYSQDNKILNATKTK